MINNFKDNDQINFIFADAQDQAKNYEFDNWYKEIRGCLQQNKA